VEINWSHVGELPRGVVHFGVVGKTFECRRSSLEELPNIEDLPPVGELLRIGELPSDGEIPPVR